MIEIPLGYLLISVLVLLLVSLGVTLYKRYLWASEVVERNIRLEREEEHEKALDRAILRQLHEKMKHSGEVDVNLKHQNY